MPTREQLEQYGKFLRFYGLNHEEWIYQGKVYVCGWSSQLNTRTGEVVGSSSI